MDGPYKTRKRHWGHSNFQPMCADPGRSVINKRAKSQEVLNVSFYKLLGFVCKMIHCRNVLEIKPVLLKQ